MEILEDRYEIAHRKRTQYPIWDVCNEYDLSAPVHYTLFPDTESTPYSPVAALVDALYGLCAIGTIVFLLLFFLIALMV